MPKRCKFHDWDTHGRCKKCGFVLEWVRSSQMAHKPYIPFEQPMVLLTEPLEPCRYCDGPVPAPAIRLWIDDDLEYAFCTEAHLQVWLAVRAGEFHKAQEAQEREAVLAYILEKEHCPPEYFEPVEISTETGVSGQRVVRIIRETFGLTPVVDKGFPSIPIYEFLNELALEFSDGKPS